MWVLRKKCQKYHEDWRFAPALSDIGYVTSKNQGSFRDLSEGTKVGVTSFCVVGHFLKRVMFVAQVHQLWRTLNAGSQMTNSHMNSNLRHFETGLAKMTGCVDQSIQALRQVFHAQVPIDDRLKNNTLLKNLFRVPGKSIGSRTIRAPFGRHLQFFKAWLAKKVTIFAVYYVRITKVMSAQRTLKTVSQSLIDWFTS